MSDREEKVILDGPGRLPQWPIELAESLLADPTTWGTNLSGYFGSSLFPSEVLEQAARTPDRNNDFSRLATQVNGYNRHPIEWAVKLFDEVKVHNTYQHYTTQELLDGSGLRFSDRGLHELKGLTGARQIFALVPA